MEIVRIEGGRKVAREVEFYSLDAIIAVGYRANCFQATQFGVWATKTLREFITKGFVLDDERLKHGKTVFGKDYFDELLDVPWISVYRPYAGCSRAAWAVSAAAFSASCFCVYSLARAW